MEYRRARTIILYWHDGELTAENYLSSHSAAEAGNALAVEPLVVNLLGRFEDWREDQDVATSFTEYSDESVITTTKSLVDCGLLQTHESTTDEEQFLTAWQGWGEEARFFHFGTKNADYVAGDEQRQMQFRRQLREEAASPPPAIFKSYPDAPRLYLTRAFLPLDQGFGEVLTSRRTHRQFTNSPVDQRVLATLLFYTFAPMLFCDADVFGTLMMRTSPSGGARHELEGYVAVFDVDGVDPGLYHYNAENHSLEQLSAHFDRPAMNRLTYDMGMPAESAFVCIVTAMFGRTMYKYHHPRNYRVTLLGAGHLGQTFALAATALGLGAWQTIVFRDDELERGLGIDGYSEGAIYLLGAGYPVTTTQGLPADLIPPHPTPPSGMIGLFNRMTPPSNDSAPAPDAAQFNTLSNSHPPTEAFSSTASAEV